MSYKYTFLCTTYRDKSTLYMPNHQCANKKRANHQCHICLPRPNMCKHLACLILSPIYIVDFPTNNNGRFSSLLIHKYRYCL